MIWLQHAAVIGLAGFFGAIARFGVGAAVTAVAPRGFPHGTLIINVTGCLFLAFFLGIIRDRAVSDAMRLAVAVGFVGSYTTFSTFIWEIYELARTGYAFRAGGYLVVSIVFGLAAIHAGELLAHRFAKS